MCQSPEFTAITPLPRRQILRRLSVVGVIAVAGTACSPSATPSATPAATTAPAQQATTAATTASTTAATTPATATTPAAASTASAGTTGSDTSAATSTTTTAGTATAASAVPACVLTPAETEGPYYFDAGMVRRDITEGKPGVPLQLQVRVVNVSNGCQPLADAVVDVWHADATGTYSGFAGQTPGGQRGQSGQTGTTTSKFLRGVQVTDTTGQATIDTIFPGWYQGRLTHIHFKIHVDDKTVFTSQWYFPAGVTQQVYANNDPYRARGQNPTTLGNDGVVRGQAEFDQLTMQVTAAGNGLVATHTVGVKL